MPIHPMRDLPEHPTPVALELSDTDGNAFAVIGAACRAARRAGWSKEQIEEYRQAAMAGSYDDLLRVTMEWFDVS